MAIQINQQQKINQQQENFKPSESINQQLQANGLLTRPLTQEEASKISVFLPQQMLSQQALSEIKYGVEKGNISQDDYNKAVKGEKMSTDGQSALQVLKQEFQVNFAKLLEFFAGNKTVGENGESLTEDENAKIDELMMNDTFGFITNEELAEVDENLAKEAAEEAKKAEEEAEEAEEPEEAPKAEEPEEPGDEERESQVIEAFKEVQNAIDNGIDLNKLEKNGSKDVKRIISDLKDDDTVANKESLKNGIYEQYEDKNIQKAVNGWWEKAVKEGKSYTYNGETRKIIGIDHESTPDRTQKITASSNSNKSSSSSESSENSKNKEKEKEKEKEVQL